MFINKVVLTQPNSFIYILSMNTVILQQQSESVATETVYPAKSKIFTIWPFVEKKLPISEIYS